MLLRAVRILMPLILFAAGIAAMGYGIGFRTLALVKEEKRQEMRAPDGPPDGMGPFGMTPGPMGMGMGMDPMARMRQPPRPPRFVTVIETLHLNEPETVVVRLVTVGKVERLKDGQLQVVERGDDFCPS